MSADRTARAAAAEPRRREVVSRRERALLACGVIGPPLFVAVFLVESVAHPPGYRPLRHTVSAFALGDFGWVQSVNFLVTGGLLLAFAVGLRPALGRYGGGRWAPVLVGLFAVGLIGSGVFAADPIAAGVTATNPYPLGTPVVSGRTLHGSLHDLFGTPVFLGLPVACCVVAYRLAAAGRKGWAAYSIGTAVAFLTCFVLTSMALAQPPLIAPVGGLLQRLTIVIGWTWLAALAVFLRRRPSATSRPHPLQRVARQQEGNMTRTMPGAPSPVPLPTTRPPGCPFDPPLELARLRTTQPISRLAYPDGHVGWLVTSHALVRAVLAHPRFSRRGELMHSPVPLATATETPRPAPPGFFIRMDPPMHTRYRRLLTGQFTVRRMRQLTPRVQQITAEHLDAMQQAGPPADLVEAFALPVPSLVICELLGVPYADREHFQRHSAVLLTLDSPEQQRLTAWTALHDYLRGLVAAKRAEPADDLLSGLATGGELTDEELTNIGLLLLVAGHETTANMLALGTFVLLRHPEQLAALRADPAGVDQAVEELLRYLTIIHVGPVRVALEDVELGGQRIKAGETVTTSVAAANRDPEQFADPDTLDLHRSAAGHLAFGHGIHQCLGQQLARIEMQVGYTALADRFPTLRLAVAPEEVPMRTNMSIYGVRRLPVTWEEAGG